MPSVKKSKSKGGQNQLLAVVAVVVSLGQNDTRVSFCPWLFCLLFVSCRKKFLSG